MNRVGKDGRNCDEEGWLRCIYMYMYLVEMARGSH